MLPLPPYEFMRIIRSIQCAPVEDPIKSKVALTIPVLRATLYSLKRERIERLGGLGAITLADLAREVRPGSGDTGICFEYAVHDAIVAQNPLISSFASEALDSFCKIRGGASSILFGPEKSGVIPILAPIFPRSSSSHAPCCNGAGLAG